LRYGGNRACIERNEVKVFLLPDQQMPGAEQIARYVENRFRIALRARKAGYAIYKVRPTAVELIAPEAPRFP